MLPDINVHDGSFQSRGQRDVFGFGESSAFAENIFVNLTQVGEEFPAWSIYPGNRDREMRKFWKTESTFAGSVYSMAAFAQGLEFKLFGEDFQNAFSEEVLHNADFGLGHRTLAAKTVVDYATQDNGVFWEKVGAGNPQGQLIGPVQAINYLDPAQCIRTFDRKFPVLYTNPATHAQHLIHHSRVIARANLPQPNELARGVGLSVLSRALRIVQSVKDIHVLRHEKIAGRFTRGIGYGTGVTAKTLQGALADTEHSEESRGLTRYRGLPFIITPQGVELNVLDLASLPEGFDLNNDSTLYIYILALCWGVDAREFWPATQSGATKADASVQSQKARGKGKADIILTLQDMFRQCLPEGTNFTYDFNDDEHDMKVSQRHMIVVDSTVKAKAAGFISATEGRAKLISEGFIDPEMLENIDDMPGMEDFEEPEPVAQLPFRTAGGEDDEGEDEEENEQGERVKKKSRPRTPFAGYYEQQSNEFQAFLRELLEEKIAEVGGIENVTPEQAGLWVDELGVELHDVFAVAATDAYGVGLAGSTGTDIGLVQLQSNYDREMGLLNGFLADLRSRWLELAVLGIAGIELVDSLTTSFAYRGELYTSVYWTSIWIGLQDMLRAETFQTGQARAVRRVLDSQAAHCNTCPPKAGVYASFESMLAVTGGLPGDLSDECGSNCRCWIEIETEPGSGAFMRWNGEPTTFARPVVISPLAQVF